MIYPNPYFFFRPPEKSDLLAIACWMSAAGRPREEEEWRVLRQLRRYYGYPARTRGPDPGNSSKADPGQASVRNTWMEVVAGAPAFLLECTVTGEVYLTGRPVIHASPWKALEAWGYSIPWRRLGCRRDKIPSFPRCRQGVNRLAWIQITNLYGKS